MYIYLAKRELYHASIFKGKLPSIPMIMTLFISHSSREHTSPEDSKWPYGLILPKIQIREIVNKEIVRPPITGIMSNISRLLLAKIIPLTLFQSSGLT